MRVKDDAIWVGKCKRQRSCKVGTGPTAALLTRLLFSRSRKQRLETRMILNHSLVLGPAVEPPNMACMLYH